MTPEKGMRLVQFALFAFLTAPIASLAWAEDLGPDGLLDLMAAAPVQAGASSTSLSWVALTASGEPWSGLKLRVSSSQGRVTQPRMVRPGIYTFSYTPPSVATGNQVVFEVTGRTEDKKTVEASASLALNPETSGSVSMTAEPDGLVLGRDEASTITLTSSSALMLIDLQASAGSVGDLLPVGEGVFKARYEPPDVTSPRVVILTAVGQVGSTESVSALALPLAGAANYPIYNESPGATLQLRVGDREFGPVKADEKGSAVVPIEVPAGITSATLIRFVDNNRTEEELPLGLPEVSRIRLFQLPSSLPSSVGTWVLHAFVSLPDGEPDTGATVEFEAAEGSIGAVSHAGGGLYRAAWTLPEEPGRVRLSASISGEGAQSHSWTVQVGAGVPEGSTLELSSDPEATRAMVVTANAQGGHGIELVGDGAVRKGPTVDRGDGVYQATFGAIGDDQVRVRALPLQAPGANEVAQLWLFPMVEHVANDGQAGVRVDVLSTDRFGAPVADAQVTLEVLSGGGQVPASVKTDAHGLAHFQYRSGTSSGVARVHARSGDAQGGGAVLQVPAATTLPDLGGLSSSTWAGLFPVLTIGEEAAAPAPAPVVVVAASTPTPSLGEGMALGAAGDAVVAIELTSSPASAVAGEELELSVIGLSSEKKRIPGLSIDLLVAGAKAGALEESEPGIYRATLYVPRKLEGPVKVSAVASGKMAFLEIPKGVAAPKEKPVKEPKVAKVKEPSTSSGSLPAFMGPSYDPAWLLARLSGAFSLYSYEQMPTAQSGPLLNQGMAVTGANRAVPMGVALQAEAWHPDMEMFGARMKLRTTRYAISASIFEGQAPDWLVDTSLEAMARYLVYVPFGRVWGGAHAGLRYDDFMLFTGCLEPGCSVGFEALAMGGMGLGLDAGAEMGSMRVTANFTQGFARFSVPHATSFELHAMYRLDSQWFVDVGGASIARSVVLQGAESGLERGTLDDHQMVFEAGAGMAF